MVGFVLDTYWYSFVLHKQTSVPKIEVGGIWYGYLLVQFPYYTNRQVFLKRKLIQYTTWN